MRYTGLVGREHRSGPRIRHGGITNVGHAHLRRILVEAAWSARHRNVVSPARARRRHAAPPGVVAIAQKAQTWRRRTFWRRLSRNTPTPVAVVAVARELAGLVWAIGRPVAGAAAV